MNDYNRRLIEEFRANEGKVGGMWEAHKMRNEITASRQYSMKRLHKGLRPHRLLAGDIAEIPSQYRKHESDISLRNSWASHV